MVIRRIIILKNNYFYNKRVGMNWCLLHLIYVKTKIRKNDGLIFNSYQETYILLTHGHFKLTSRNQKPKHINYTNWNKLLFLILRDSFNLELKIEKISPWKQCLTVDSFNLELKIEKISPWKPCVSVTLVDAYPNLSSELPLHGFPWVSLRRRPTD